MPDVTKLSRECAARIMDRIEMARMVPLPILSDDIAREVERTLKDFVRAERTEELKPVPQPFDWAEFYAKQGAIPLPHTAGFLVAEPGQLVGGLYDKDMNRIFDDESYAEWSEKLRSNRTEPQRNWLIQKNPNAGTGFGVFPTCNWIATVPGSEYVQYYITLEDAIADCEAKGRSFTVKGEDGQ